MSSYIYHEPSSPSDNAERWRSYVDQLPWYPGQLDESSYCAFLRAGSLGIDRQAALDAVVCRLSATNACLRRAKVESQLARAYQHAGCAPTTGSVAAKGGRATPWPERDVALREQIVSGGPGLYDFWESSPVRFEDEKAHTEQVTDVLFPNNPLLCAGKSNSLFWTASRESFRDRVAEIQFIVSSPMLSLYGHTKEGKLSAHTLEHTGPRRFLVIEFDQGTPDEQAALLDYLARRGPLAMAVHSGNKSLHGWFYCAGTPDDVLRRFMTLAVRLGADLATWRNRSQFVRMPDGRRSDGNRQRIFYFNPQSI